MTEDRPQTTEDRQRKTEDRPQSIDDRPQTALTTNLSKNITLQTQSTKL